MHADEEEHIRYDVDDRLCAEMTETDECLEDMKDREPNWDNLVTHKDAVQVTH